MGGRGGSSGLSSTKPVLSRVDGHSRFFGDYQNVTNQYFKFDHVVDDKSIILITKNVTEIKGSPVLVVDDNKAVYLKDFNIQPVKLDTRSDLGDVTYAYAVRINKDYFKPYTFKSNIGDFSFSKEDTFESLKKLARSQNKTAVAIDKKWNGKYKQ